MSVSLAESAQFAQPHWLKVQVALDCHASRSPHLLKLFERKIAKLVFESAHKAEAGSFAVHLQHVPSPVGPWCKELYPDHWVGLALRCVRLWYQRSQFVRY